MSFNNEVDIGVLVEELSVRLDVGLLIGTEVRLVVIKIDVFDGLAKEIFVRGRRSCGHWRLCLRDRQARSGVLRSAGTFSGEVVGGGSGGCNRLRSTGLNRANAIDGNVGGVGGLPAQSCGLASLNGIGTDRDGGCG